MDRLFVKNTSLTFEVLTVVTTASPLTVATTLVVAGLTILGCVSTQTYIKSIQAHIDNRLDISTISPGHQLIDVQSSQFRQSWMAQWHVCICLYIIYLSILTCAILESKKDGFPIRLSCLRFLSSSTSEGGHVGRH